MLHFIQHDKTEDVIPSVSEESTAWMLRCAQHDKSGKRGCFAALSMTRPMSFRTLFFVIPNASEESTAWMLRCAQHDKGGVVPHALFCHSERSKESTAWMLRCAQHIGEAWMLHLA